MSPGSLPPPVLPGLQSLWAGGASRVAVSCPGQQCRGDAMLPGLFLSDTRFVRSRNAPCPELPAGNVVGGSVLAWRRMQAAAQVQAPGSSKTRVVSAGFCCKKPLERRVKQRFVVLLLCLGKKEARWSTAQWSWLGCSSLVLIMTFTRASSCRSAPEPGLACRLHDLVLQGEHDGCVREDITVVGVPSLGSRCC